MFHISDVSSLLDSLLCHLSRDKPELEGKLSPEISG